MKKISGFGLELRLARVRAGMSQKQLETFFKGHPTGVTLQNVEQDKHRPKPETVRAIWDFINMSPEAVAARVRKLSKWGQVLHYCNYRRLLLNCAIARPAPLFDPFFR